MEIPSHYRPRTRIGRFRWIYFVTTFLLTQWPFISWANRIEPQIFGLPFFYMYLNIVYTLILAGLATLWPGRKS